MIPSIDFTAFALSLVFLFVLFLTKMLFFSTKKNPSIAFSRTAQLSISTWRTRLVHYPNRLHFLGFAFLLFAFIDPHVLIPFEESSNGGSSSTVPTEGIAIYLVLDQSGSMSQPAERGSKQTKISLLKNVTKDFILKHPSDLIGIVSFARIPQVLVPLTLDQNTLIDELNRLQVVKNEEEDGTGIGYAIYKTARLIAATKYFAEGLEKGKKVPYTIKNAVMIVVTDGFQDPNRLDQGNRLRTIELEEASAYAASQGIRLYVINVDASFSSPQFAPHRRQLEAITRSTGGEFDLATDAGELEKFYAKIDRLEKGMIQREVSPSTSKTDNNASFSRFSFYPFFLAIGLIAVLSALCLETFVIKTIP